MSDDLHMIRPRTKAEQKAYMDGYADCLVEITNNGQEAAARWLIQMIDVDQPEIATKMLAQLEAGLRGE